MIATGQTLHTAASILMDQGVEASRIRVIGLIAASEGIEYFYSHKAYADIKMHVAAVDFQLNDDGFIVPGLGDAGDRQFGTEKPRSTPAN